MKSLCGPCMLLGIISLSEDPQMGTYHIMVSYAILSDQAIIQNPDPHLMDKHLHKFLAH